MFGWKENIVPKMHIVQCGDVEEVEDDAGDSDSEEEESYNEDLEPPVVTLLRTLSSLSDDDQKCAELALQL